MAVKNGHLTWAEGFISGGSGTGKKPSKVLWRKDVDAWINKRNGVTEKDKEPHKTKAERAEALESAGGWCAKERATGVVMVRGTMKKCLKKRGALDWIITKERV